MFVCGRCTCVGVGVCVRVCVCVYTYLHTYMDSSFHVYTVHKTAHMHSPEILYCIVGNFGESYLANSFSDGIGKN